jgi:predicted secreted protein
MRYTALMLSALTGLVLGSGVRFGWADENCPSGQKAPAKQSPSSSSSLDEIQLSLAQKGKTLVTQLGRTFCLRLPGDRANGTWSLTKLTGDALKQTGKAEYVSGPHDPGKVGGVSIFRFTAAKPGKSTIKASFAPAQKQKGKPATNNYSVDIVVTNRG